MSILLVIKIEFICSWSKRNAFLLKAWGKSLMDFYLLPPFNVRERHNLTTPLQTPTDSAFQRTPHTCINLLPVYPLLSATFYPLQRIGIDGSKGT